MESMESDGEHKQLLDTNQMSPSCNLINCHVVIVIFIPALSILQFISIFPLQTKLKSLKIAVIGQSKFGADVYKLLRKQGHEIVGVFTIPDKDGRPDLLGE